MRDENHNVTGTPQGPSSRPEQNISTHVSRYFLHNPNPINKTGKISRHTFVRFPFADRAPVPEPNQSVHEPTDLSRKPREINNNAKINRHKKED
jgi:hypothetical protein